MLLFLALGAADPDIAEAARREVARQECRLKERSDEVVVCGRRDMLKRYQVTDPDAPWDPLGTTESVARERATWIQEGDTGVQSCGPVGPGGWTGCTVKQWKRERQQELGWYN